jgi:hypothetical protein
MVKNIDFWYVKPYCLMVYRRFGGKFCLNILHKYSTPKIEAQILFKTSAKFYQITQHYIPHYTILDS